MTDTTGIDEINIQHWFIYGVLVVAIAILIRVIISWMKMIEYPKTALPDRKMKDFNGLQPVKKFQIIFRGTREEDPSPDFWYNTILGVVELGIFPILMKAHQYGMIGAWIGFKSVAQWRAWNKNRYVFNRFLLAHAAIVIISWFMMNYITVYP